MDSNSESSETYFFKIYAYITTFAVVILTFVVIRYLQDHSNQRFRQTRASGNSDVFTPIQRLERLYNGVVLDALHLFFELRILENKNWNQYLKDHLHELFHFYKQKINCCKNNDPSPCALIPRLELLKQDQFNLLYKSDPSIPASHEQKDIKEKVLQHCICPFSPNTETDVSKLDITLICCLMKTCRRTPAGNPEWFKDVKTVRNKIFHRGVDSTFSEKQVEEYRQILEDAIVNIAGTISPTYHKGVKRRILELNENFSQLDEIKKVFKSENEYLEQKILGALENLLVNTESVRFRLTPKFQKEEPKRGSSANSSSRKDLTKCTVVWTFSTPGYWDVKDMQKKLDGINVIGDYDIEFTYGGSFIVCTTTELYHLLNIDGLKDSIEEFLTLFMLILKLPAETGLLLDVEFAIWCHKEDTASQDNSEDSNASIVNQPLEIPTDVKLNLIKKIDIPGFFTDCSTIEDMFVISDFDNSRLILCDKDGVNKRFIPVSGYPWMVTAIENKSVAVRIGRDEIATIDIDTSSIINKFCVDGYILGLSYFDHHLYVSIKGIGIHVMDLDGQIIRQIATECKALYIEIYKDKIYYIHDTTVFCCDMSGKTLWKCKVPIIHSIRGMKTDEEGNIYLTGFTTNNVVMVTADGKEFKQLLSKFDGLNRPRAICYNEKLKTFMMCNMYCPVFFYLK